jgi:excisionase family DNA binding protein
MFAKSTNNPSVEGLMALETALLELFIVYLVETRTFLFTTVLVPCIHDDARVVKAFLSSEVLTMSSEIKLLDVGDVAIALRVSPHTVRRWAAQKKLRRVKLGSRTLFDPSDVARFVERARKGNAGDAVSENSSLTGSQVSHNT